MLAVMRKRFMQRQLENVQSMYRIEFNTDRFYHLDHKIAHEDRHSGGNSKMRVTLAKPEVKDGSRPAGCIDLTENYHEIEILEVDITIVAKGQIIVLFPWLP